MKDQLSLKNRKKQRKEIRSAQKIPLIQDNTPVKTPKKIMQKRKELMDSFTRHMKIKKARHNTKNSKRTTPGIGITTTDAQPAHTHIEGARWIKTTIKQNLAQQKILNRNGAKKK
ncbi:hypothetical protein [Candidatus Rhabdochlamydia sp. T3358]|uniref:hypothetical protein n=1 Tax=Candidatus Rhabdochlamydia sp. T3358 TaxID=2099795 RepID=UPI0010B077E0|nr:hypothetical protein [Candidatus Rhabdochlamydia sp. T3358]VHO02072.1 hypothetical protein RHT_00391 [Candidatus Rhabdochlamydia sp. T3358]